MTDFFKDKDILVTGGCGSIGSQIVKRLLLLGAKRIRVFDSDEAGHWRLSMEHQEKPIRHLIGDVRDLERLRTAMRGVDIVFHAAALKHVPFCEYNPFEAVHTNVVGTQNVIAAAINENVKLVVGISTDKAVNPVSTMGATKLLAEKILTNAPVGYSTCTFCCVRFGNVLNSVGSVIPVFTKQIEKGGPVTITSEQMTRFFMSIEDAVTLILQSAEQAKGGETFILKMSAIKITDLAQVLIDDLAPRYGHDPKKIHMKIIGVRPGEKLHELLMTPDEAQYMIERENTIVLFNSLLAEYGKDLPVGRSAPNHDEYNSGKLALLSQAQIKEILYANNILRAE